MAGYKRRAEIAEKLTKTAGFSVVELLVVVALITILVSVALPVTIQCRNRARSAACLSNLRQLSGALIAYSQDWDDKLPSLNATPFVGSAASDKWHDGTSATQLREATSKYVRNGGVYQCKNDLGSPEFGFGSSNGSVFSRAGSSYLPWSTARTGLYGVALNGARPSLQTSISKCCLLREYGSDWHGYSKRSGLDVEVTTIANGAYADGHAVAVPILSVTISGRSYVCYPSVRAGVFFISGGSGDVQAELSGRSRTQAEATGRQRFQLCLSGTVSGGGVSHNVDRVFSFGSDTQLDAAFRQIAAWADGLVTR